MRMNVTLSNKTKVLIEKMQSELKDELDTNVTFGFAIGQALERYFEYKEKEEKEEKEEKDNID